MRKIMIHFSEFNLVISLLICYCIPLIYCSVGFPQHNCRNFKEITCLILVMWLGVLGYFTRHFLARLKTETMRVTFLLVGQAVKLGFNPL